MDLSDHDHRHRHGCTGFGSMVVGWPAWDFALANDTGFRLGFCVRLVATHDAHQAAAQIVTHFQHRQTLVATLRTTVPSTLLSNPPRSARRLLVVTAAMVLPTAWLIGGEASVRIAFVALLTVGLTTFATAATARAVGRGISVNPAGQLSKTAPMLELVLGMAVRMLLLLVVLAVALGRAPVSLPEADRGAFGVCFGLFYFAMLVGEIRDLIVRCQHMQDSHLRRQKETSPLVATG